MKKHAAIKNIILLLIMLTVIIDGLFFGARESIELSDNYGFRCTADDSTHSIPLRDSALIWVAINEIKAPEDTEEKKEERSKDE